MKTLKRPPFSFRPTAILSGDPGRALAATASHWYSIPAIASDADTIANSGSNGDVATLGSTAGSDSDDPTIDTYGAASFLRTDGVADYLQLPASAEPTFTPASGDFTVVVLARVGATPANYKRLWSAEGTADRSLQIQSDNTGKFRARIQGDTTSASTSSASIVPVDEWYVFAAKISDGDLISWSSTDGASSTVDASGVGTLTHGSPRVGEGAYGSGSNMAVDIGHVLQFGSALSNDDLTTLSTYLLSTYPARTSAQLFDAMDLLIAGADDYTDGDVDDFTASSGQTIEIGSDDTAGDTSDPVVTVAGSEGYFHFPGADAGNIITVVENADTQRGDDIDIRWKVRIDDVDQTAVIACRWGDGTDSWLLRHTSTIWSWWGANSEGAGVTHGLNDGDTVVARMTKVDDEVKFYHSSDEGETWVQQGTTQTCIDLDDPTGAGEVAIGARSSGSEPFTGLIYWLEMRDGIDSETKILEVNGSNAGHDTFGDSAVGELVTLTRTDTNGQPPLAWVPPNTGWTLHDDANDYLTFLDTDFKRTADAEFTLLVWFIWSGQTEGTGTVIGSVDSDNTGEFQFRTYESTGGMAVSVRSDPNDTIDTITGSVGRAEGDFCFAAIRQQADGTLEFLETENGGTVVLEATVAGVANEDSFTSNGGGVRIGIFNTTGNPGTCQIGGIAASYDEAITLADLQVISDRLNEIYNPP